MHIIGIDLGTSNHGVTALRSGRPVITPSTEGVALGGSYILGDDLPVNSCSGNDLVDFSRTLKDGTRER